MTAAPEDLLDEVLEAKILTGEDVDEASPVVRKAVLAEIARAQGDLADEVRTGPDGRILLHRSIALSDDALAALSPGDALGSCWAFDARGAHGYNAKAGVPAYVLSGWVEPRDVVGEHVLAMWSSGENEARLDRRGTIELVGMRDAKGDAVRTDLEGAEFGTDEPRRASPGLR